MAECKQCGKEYKAKRSTSAYCGPKCKQEFYRNRIKPVVTLSNAKPVTVTNAKPGVVWESEPGAASKIAEIMKPKRGKDITCFEDLPPHVQQAVDSLSMVDGKVDKTLKANRTAIAINYQHQFPDRYHSTGVG